MNGLAVYTIIGAESSYQSLMSASAVMHSLKNMTRRTNMLSKDIPHSPTSNTQERRASNTIQKPRYKHSLNIPCKRTRNHPY